MSGPLARLALIPIFELVTNQIHYFSSLTTAISSQSGNLTHFKQSVQILWGSTDLSTLLNPKSLKKLGLIGQGKYPFDPQHL